MPNLAQFRACVVQAAPVYLDLQASVEKACRLIKEAALGGAQLVAFPEAFLPAYPYWNWILNPIDGSPWFEKLYKNSVDRRGPEVSAICAAARQNGCVVVIGINEKDPVSIGTLYNSTLIIDEQGQVLGCHRKLVPTWAEKLTWTGGDGSTLNVYDTVIGPLGALACGENTNTLARYSLLAQGELVHVATYISLPLVGGYDMVEAIKIRAGAHSFEGKLFTLVACGAISEEIIEILAGKDVGLAQRLRRTGSAFSGIFGPDGRLVTEPLIDEEGMRFADIDLNLCIQPKQMHDITGHYNRFDVFQLHIDKRQKTPLSFASPSTNAQVRTRIEGENGEDDAGLATWPDRIAKEPTRKVR